MIKSRFVTQNNILSEPNHLTVTGDKNCLYERLYRFF